MLPFIDGVNIHILLLWGFCLFGLSLWPFSWISLCSSTALIHHSAK